MIGEKGMSSDRNGGAFRSGDVLCRQQGYTGFGRGSLETHMKGLKNYICGISGFQDIS